MNSEISKLLGTPMNVSEGNHTRSGPSGEGAGSLGKGDFLPDKSRISYGTGGVDSGKKGRYGPTGRT